MLEANCDSELRQALSEADIAVPLRTEGRTKEHTERYAIAHLLSALLHAGLVAYPFRLIHRDRPDFLLYMGGVRIGVEHVEAISENEAHRGALRERGHGPQIYFISHNKPGEPKRKANKLLSEIEENEGGDGWVGDMVEKEWAEAMSHSVQQKVNVVRKEGFESFDEDWLLIYDNWTLPCVEIENASLIFYDLITATGAFQEFKCIFIISGKHLCEVSRRGVQLHTVNDFRDTGSG